MGKGDQRTKRGKVWRSSYGKTRTKSAKKNPTWQKPKSPKKSQTSSAS